MGDVRLGESWTWSQRLRNAAIYGIARASLWGALDVAPRGALGQIGATLGGGVSAAMPRMRRRAEERLRAAFGGTPPVCATEVFEALGRDLADVVRLLDHAEAADATMGLGLESEALIRQALGEGRGVVFVTAHLGPIERMAAVVAERGYPVVTLARESYDPRFTALYEQLRQPRGVRTIYRGQAGADVRMVRALRAGSLVGFPMDLAGRGMATVACDFLGERTALPLGPARIAQRTGAVLLAGTPQGRGNGAVEVTVERLDAGGSEAGLVERIAGVLERRILAWPAHWPWMHGA